MILIDATHTSHCRANTGIQRVTRRLVREFGESATPMVHDLFGRKWRHLDAMERGLIEYPAHFASSRKRSAAWSFSQKWRGRMLFTGLSSVDFVRDPAGAIIVPEVFSTPRGPDAFSDIRRITGAPLIGIFNDIIPLLMPGHTPVSIVAKFEKYLETLRTFDAIAAISEFSRDGLLKYWRDRGVAHPPVVAIPLGVDAPAAACHQRADALGRVPVILSVGTLEGRKNHLSLLRACETLWSSGFDFELVLFGGANLETAGEAVGLIKRLMSSGRRLRWVRGGSDDEMEAEYARADFTVYPSLMEGFGLPVLESLARGRPVVCSGENAMAETARDGGCLVVGYPSEAALAEGIGSLLKDPLKLSRLREEACSRKIRSWGDYVAELKVFAESFRAPGAVNRTGP